MDEVCGQCKALIHNKDEHLLHFHFGNEGEGIICVPCLSTLMDMNYLTAIEIWRLGRKLVPAEHLTAYNSGFSAMFYRLFVQQGVENNGKENQIKNRRK